jgi:transcriptional regulator GlxA family with amidase domain
VTPVWVLRTRMAALQTALQVTDLAMKSCGGAAFSRHLGVERCFRDARAGWVMAPTVDHLSDDNAPKIDVLVVPSGAGSLKEDQQNVRVINWIKKAASEAKFITSHCQGAFLLSKAGLLDHKEATTFTANTEDLRKQYPACRVQADCRVVVDGNLVTSPGGLASYEASLYVVEQLFGKEQALSIASALIFGPSNIEAATAAR